MLLDDEDFLSCPQSLVKEPQETDTTDDSSTHKENHIAESRDDLVTTTTPEPTIGHLNFKLVETSETVTQPDTSRSILKRASDTKQSGNEENVVSVEAKKLRVEAPEFVPALYQSELQVSEAEDREDDLVEESMSFVSTSTDFVDLQDEELMSSQNATSDKELTESSISLSIMAMDELEPEVSDETDDTHQHVICSSQSTAEDASEINEAASSTGMEESDSDLTSCGKPDDKHVLPEFETEDSDDGNERLNPKHRVERDNADGNFNLFFRSMNILKIFFFADAFKVSQTSSNIQRNQNRGGHRGPGGFAGGDRRQNSSRFPSQPFNQFAQHLSHSGSENFNPHFANHYRPTANERGPSLLMNPHTAPVPLLQFRGLLPPHQPNFRPMYDGGRPRMGGGPALLSRHQRPQMQRPSFPSQLQGQPPFRLAFSGNPTLRMPPRFDHHQSRMMNAQQNQSQPIPLQFLPPRLLPPPHQQHSMPYGAGPRVGQGNPLIPAGHGGSHSVASNLSREPAQPIIPRKVLINPNFKGGVEAATSE